MDVKGGDAWSRGLFSLSDARTESAPVELCRYGSKVDIFAVRQKG